MASQQNLSRARNTFARDPFRNDVSSLYSRGTFGDAMTVSPCKSQDYSNSCYSDGPFADANEMAENQPQDDSSRFYSGNIPGDETSNPQDPFRDDASSYYSVGSNEATEPNTSQNRPRTPPQPHANMPKPNSKLKALQKQEEELTSNFVNALCRLQAAKSKAMAVGDYLIREWSGLDDMNAYAATVAAADIASDLPEVVPSQPSRRRDVLKESKKQMAHSALVLQTIITYSHCHLAATGHLIRHFMEVRNLAVHQNTALPLSVLQNDRNMEEGVYGNGAASTILDYFTTPTAGMHREEVIEDNLAIAVKFATKVSKIAENKDIADHLAQLHKQNNMLLAMTNHIRPRLSTILENQHQQPATATAEFVLSQIPDVAYEARWAADRTVALMTSAAHLAKDQYRAETSRTRRGARAVGRALGRALGRAEEIFENDMRLIADCKSDCEKARAEVDAVLASAKNMGMSPGDYLLEQYYQGR